VTQQQNKHNFGNNSYLSWGDSYFESDFFFYDLLQSVNANSGMEFIAGQRASFGNNSYLSWGDSYFESDFFFYDLFQSVNANSGMEFIAGQRSSFHSFFP
jgi:hypothetical protein